MISKYKNYLFIIEDFLYNSPQERKEWIKFINKIPINKRYFATYNCDVSRQSLYSTINNLDIKCNFYNILTPSYLLLDYCKSIYSKTNIYPISYTMDFHDFYLCNIKIDFIDPNLIIISTNEISKKDMTTINNFNIPLIFSSNLCTNRFDTCITCNDNCNLKYIKTFYKNRLIIPDSPPYYNTTYLFKKFNIDTKDTILVTSKFRNDNLESQKNGCKIALVLKDRLDLEEYIKSPYDVDIVAENLDNLSYWLNLKEET
ncbi:MAG: hypothetical protein AB2417_05025 [Clostridiaceae bacterium]